MQIERSADGPWAGFAEPANDACFQPDTAVESTPAPGPDPDRWIVSNPWLRGAFTRRPSVAIPDALDRAGYTESAATRPSLVVRSIRFFIGLH